MNPASPPCVSSQRRSWFHVGRISRLGCGDFGLSRVACRVLAPPEAHGKRPRSASVDASTPSSSASDFWSSTTTFASQLLSHFKVSAFAAATPDAVLMEASSKERELQSAKTLLDVTPFLQPVGVWELKLIRKLSSLTAITYYMHLVTPRRLLRMHNVELVTTSRACDIRPYEHSKTAEEVGADGDGMAVSLPQAHQVYAALKEESSSEAAAAAAAVMAAAAAQMSRSSNIVTLPRELPYELLVTGSAGASMSQQGTTSSGGGGGGPGPSWPLPSILQPSSPAPPSQPQQSSQSSSTNSGFGLSSSSSSTQGGSNAPSVASGSAPPQPSGLSRVLRSPAEVVAAKLAEAALAASAAAASPLASAAESLYAGLASLPIGSAFLGNSNSNTGGNVAPGGGAAGGSLSSAADAAALEAGTGGGSFRIDGGRKATAAGIAAVATDRLRQQSMRGGGVGGSGMLSPAAAMYGTGASASAAASATALTSAPSPSSSSLTFSTSVTYMCPSEWFVVDDAATKTRIFVIQGSDTLDHWKLNLTFDPVVFEEPSLGVKVHRGVYEAASVLYERFLPHVYEHLESSPFNKISFTGHSIGGSLATLLMLMYRARGVLPPHSISPVYTFGAPAVFCHTHSHSSHNRPHGNSTNPSSGNESAGRTSPAANSANSSSSGSSGSESASAWSLGGSSVSLSAYEDPAAPPTAPPGCGCGDTHDLLAGLQLPPHSVRNVIMARDVVPRAFACDYGPVTDILKGWGAAFRAHSGLNRDGRKHLYYFIGRMCILQPDRKHPFVAGDSDHPMLPPGPELYNVVDERLLTPTTTTTDSAPTNPSATTATNTSRPATSASAPRTSSLPATTPPNSALVAAGPAAGAVSRRARSVVEAVMELMDCPHPLETLADPGAYLASGSISRYHNPDNYTRALGRIKHLKKMEEVAGGTEVRLGPIAVLPPWARRGLIGEEEGAVWGRGEEARGGEEWQEEEEQVAPWDGSDGLDMELRRAVDGDIWY